MRGQISVSERRADNVTCHNVISLFWGDKKAQGLVGDFKLKFGGLRCFVYLFIWTMCVGV